MLGFGWPARRDPSARYKPYTSKASRNWFTLLLPPDRASASGAGLLVWNPERNGWGYDLLGSWRAGSEWSALPRGADCIGLCPAEYLGVAKNSVEVATLRRRILYVLGRERSCSVATTPTTTLTTVNGADGGFSAQSSPSGLSAGFGRQAGTRLSESPDEREAPNVPPPSRRHPCRAIAGRGARRGHPGPSSSQGQAEGSPAP